MHPGPLDDPEVAALSQHGAESTTRLRALLRQGIAGDIALVLERDVFQRRLVDLVAQATGRAMVAIYLRVGERSGLVLGGRTSAIPDSLPARMPRPTADEQPALESIELSDFNGSRQLVRLTVPISHERGTAGYLVVLSDEPGFKEQEVPLFQLVAAEIAPAIGVADQHHVVRQACVIDMATGAFTFEYFNQRLSEELSRAGRSGHAVTIILIEPLNYVEFERSAGYECGDHVLRALAGDFAAVTRISDVVSRHGRTGYAVLLPESDGAGALVAISRIRRRLAMLGDQLATVGLSETSPRFAIGAASFPADGDDPGSLLLIAEQRRIEDETTPSYAQAS